MGCKGQYNTKMFEEVRTHPENLAVGLNVTEWSSILVR
jgi:hypothetical protein